MAATDTELGDRLGDVLADRFLYHFVVRRLALQLLGEDDEWGGMPILSAGPDPRRPEVPPLSVAGAMRA